MVASTANAVVAGNTELGAALTAATPPTACGLTRKERGGNGSGADVAYRFIAQDNVIAIAVSTVNVWMNPRDTAPACSESELGGAVSELAPCCTARYRSPGNVSFARHVVVLLAVAVWWYLAFSISLHDTNMTCPAPDDVQGRGRKLAAAEECRVIFSLLVSDRIPLL